MVLGKLSVPGRSTNSNNSRTSAYCLAVGEGGGHLDIFSVIFHFSLFFLPLSRRQPNIDWNTTSTTGQVFILPDLLQI